ncbi:protein FAR1-RELATED SEQUENCE 9-like [Impatiens glandulifera]|uniref:protein FAR1-RELATED SEQUENCE 9-like n=1 Tax=Impatiens glandulifera TaxID=253017 RepID=UPI001FB08619|nr:protein FAR1-RELATED SEQUENCE 9-like [Impatiens glandulifera]
MTTTQRSESMNSLVKRYVNYKHKFLDFFNHFERLLDDRRYQELKADFRANTSIPSLLYPVVILKEASSIYTLEAFKCFEMEWCKSHDFIVEICEDVGSLQKYKVTSHLKRYHHIVTVDSSCEKFECGCRKFEFGGILCSHILRIFTVKNIMSIPKEYILKRWTRKVKVEYFEVNDSNANKVNLDPKIHQNIRYKELCGLYVQLVTKEAEREDTYKVVKDGILDMLKLIDEKLQAFEIDDTNVLNEKNV